MPFFKAIWARFMRNADFEGHDFDSEHEPFLPVSENVLVIFTLFLRLSFLFHSCLRISMMF